LPFLGVKNGEKTDSVRTFLQILAFLSPPPVNVWLLRLGSAKIGKGVIIHPGVLLLARYVEIGSGVKIRFGTVVNCRRVRIGDKCLIGYFVQVKGISDLATGPACVIGPQTMINCDCPVTLGHYSGVGPACTLFTHGSFLPVTEGYRATFGPIELKDRAWVTMRSTIGPGVTIGEGTNVMPGTVLLESVGSQRLVAGNPAKLVNIPLIRRSRKKDLDVIGHEILEKYREWVMENKEREYTFLDGTLEVPFKGTRIRISVDGDTDIVLLTKSGEKTGGMFFNLADLTTDSGKHPVKKEFEAYMRLYYGMTFL
jgi:acetyltransferase-like isoleucine patch superfamily enzyme